jgi:hypothetical protein
MGRRLMMDALEHWIVDRNGDGYPDDVSVRLVVAAGSDAEPAFWARLLDLAAQIGLETHALPFPLVVDHASAVPDDAEAILLRKSEDIPAVSAASFPPRCRSGLE